MSVVTVRGGFPHVLRLTVPTAGRHHQLPSTCLYLVIRATTNACKLYFSQADYDADANFVTVPVAAAETPHGEWRGPVEAKEVWMKALVGGSVVELVTFQRRG